MSAVLTGTVPSTDRGIVDVVLQAYSDKAKDGADPEYAKTVAKAFGYTQEQLQSIPAESHMGLSCGNPVATASLKPGETVLDLGSGGGIDVFLAAAKVGPEGQAIGLDMSADMITLARRNAAKKGLKPPHVAFVQALLTEPLPIASDSMDCILSNCVINLLPISGKAALLKEVHRVLKPGGRIVLDDIIVKKPLPESLRSNLSAYVGCIAGALQLDEYKRLLTDAGFADALFVDTKGDLNIYAVDGNLGCCPPTNPTSPVGGCCAPKSASSPGCPPKTTSSNSSSSPSSTSKGCCSPDTPVVSGGCAPKLVDTAPMTPAISDLNEWAASFQIYAMKTFGNEDATPSKSTTSSVLLNWADAYPFPKAVRVDISCEEVVAAIKSQADSFAVIDVRRNDHTGGHVRGSTQCPAQTFYDDLPSFYSKFSTVERVVFYCNSSGGRGPRCAAWYQDYLNERGNTASKALVMTGGIKAWLQKYKEIEELTDQD
ncbi:S-adenosyl-L-methionine-dependent methyltransferase [Hygrophoropsis aurantiaca]|uniref:S-adenosyl-L-methionine-dependent methyltransferase n=1 Tax=Hygrophoropsis aurantiaca TaxID=72124 RepID=A0ACB8A5N5_9AGAM|nr:S-adenosyl-L-methionine-dependent methyltransferase [Hygrophoropsis aurantiaca]